MFISLGCAQLDTEDVTDHRTFISSQVPAGAGRGRGGRAASLSDHAQNAGVWSAGLSDIRAQSRVCAPGLLRSRRGHRGSYPRIPPGTLVLLRLLHSPGQSPPGPETEAVCQGHRDLESFSWGGRFCHTGRQKCNSFGAVMGQFGRYGFEFTFGFSLTKETSIMYN